MFTQNLKYIVKTNTDRLYSLECSPDSPLEEIKQVIEHMHKDIESKIVELQKEEQNKDEKDA